MTNIIQIPLTKGLFSIVDRDDLEIVNKYKWRCNTSDRYKNKYAGTGYAKKYQSMHRLIMGNPKGMVVDHINGDTLDNRRENLRVCTQAENARNRQLTTNTNFKGVSMRSGRFRATICLNYKCHHIGWYETEEQAAIAYNNKAIELFGEFAKINEVNHENRHTCASS